MRRADRREAAFSYVPRQDGSVSDIHAAIMSVLAEIEPLMLAAFDAVGGKPEPGSALDQVFLLNGREVVEDYLLHGEPGLAFDHLVYMITEPPLSIPSQSRHRLLEAGREMGLEKSRPWLELAEGQDG